MCECGQHIERRLSIYGRLQRIRQEYSEPLSSLSKRYPVSWSLRPILR